MNEAKHTPGPWTVGRMGQIVRIRHDGIPEIVAEHVSKQADRNLIAAAPDLLRELKHLVQLLDMLEQEGRLKMPGLAPLNGARLAIAKATDPANT